MASALGFFDLKQPHTEISAEPNPTDTESRSRKVNAGKALREKVPDLPRNGPRRTAASCR